MTRLVYELDGVVREWRSRPHRKHGRRTADGGSVWRARWWWIALLFMVGASCFALGSLPGYVSLVGAGVDGVTFFVGSIFFTSAAYLQFLEVVTTEPDPAGEGRAFRLASWEPGRIDWLATAIQFAGTLFFNASTFWGMVQAWGAETDNMLVWRPDALGSVCFLVASGLAFAEAGHAWVSWHPADLGWSIAAINLVGSVLFGISAVGAYVIPSTGELLSASLANGGTLLGAICFFVGAALLIPEASSAPVTTASPGVPAGAGGG